MKIEIGSKKPENILETWPGEYDFFSHYEHAAVVPQVLSLITTLKENGAPNACFHCGTIFSGDSSGYFALLSGISPASHTYHNILREKEFCVNFLSGKYYDACKKTVTENHAENDELAAGGLTREKALKISAPRVAEAHLSFECTLESVQDITGRGAIFLVIGRVRNAAAAPGLHVPSAMCGADGFMYNIPSPVNPLTGAREHTAMAELHLSRVFGE